MGSELIKAACETLVKLIPGGQTVTDGNGIFLSGYDFDSIVVTTFGFNNQFLFRKLQKARSFYTYENSLNLNVKRSSFEIES